MDDYNKNPDEDTSLLIEDTRHKLEEVNSETKGKHKDIESESKGKKKKIIRDSASALGGTFREDTIAMVLVQGLKGVASGRFIRQCLPEKYKQKHRVINAKKQKKKKAIKEDEKLAAIIMKTPLNSQIEEGKEEYKKKQVVLVNVDGSTSIQNDDNSESESEPEKQVTWNPFKASSYPQQQSFQQENNDNEEIKEYSVYKESSLEDSDTDDDDNLNKGVVTSAVDASEDKMISIINNDKGGDNNILRIEYSIYYKDLYDHMASEYKKSGTSGKIYFNGKIHKDTGRVLSFNIGKLDHKQ